MLHRKQIDDCKAMILNMILDKPAFIINNNGKIKKRIGLHSENIIVRIHLDIIKEIGIRKYNLVTRKIGQQMGQRLVQLEVGNTHHENVIKDIENFSRFFIFHGIFLKKIDTRREKIIFESQKTAISRMTGSHELYLGLFESAISIVAGSEYKGFLKKIKNDTFTYTFKKTNNKKYKPIFIAKPLNCEIGPIKDVEAASFMDLVKFKKIKIDKTYRFYINGSPMFFADTNFLNALHSEYKKYIKKDRLKKIVINSARQYAKKIMPDYELEKKITFLKNIFSALGWGEIRHKKNKNKYKVKIMRFPQSKYNLEYETLVIIGYISACFKIAPNKIKINLIENKNIIELNFEVDKPKA